MFIITETVFLKIRFQYSFYERKFVVFQMSWLYVNCIEIICMYWFQGMLTHWTKKIIVEDGHSVAQLVHILQLVVRHYKVYYPVRHHLIQHMVNSLQRLGFTQSVSMMIDTKTTCPALLFVWNLITCMLYY
jgi:hypothetical protein